MTWTLVIGLRESKNLVKYLFGAYIQTGVLSFINQPTRVTNENATSIDPILNKAITEVRTLTRIVKINISDHVLNHFHNILRLFDVLSNFLFTISKKMRDYYL